MLDREVPVDLIDAQAMEIGVKYIRDAVAAEFRDRETWSFSSETTKGFCLLTRTFGYATPFAHILFALLALLLLKR